MTTIDRVQALPAGRPALELMTAQLRAIDRWHAARRACDSAAAAATRSREMRLDLSRRAAACERERAAIVARAQAQLAGSGAGGLSTLVAVRAVLAHRQPWLRDTVAGRLQERGVVVTGVFDDGADAAGTVVAEQPELVLVEDRLPTLSGAEVVRRVRRFAPAAVVGAQCLDGDGVAPLVEAGAQAVFTRRVPPREVADQLLECLLAAGGPRAAR